MATRSKGGSSDPERFRRQLDREAAAARRAKEAARKVAERDAKIRYVAGRKQEVEKKSAQLAARVEEISSILRRGITRSSAIDLARLRRADPLPPLDLGGLATPAARPAWEQFAPPAPGVFGGFFGGQERHRRAVQAAETEFAQAQQSWEYAEGERQRRVAAARADHARRAQVHEEQLRAYNAALDWEQAGLVERDHQAVERYLNRVLAALPLPEGFPRQADVYFDDQAEQAGIKLQLPGQEIAPIVRQYQYIAARDEEKVIARPIRGDG